MSASATLAATPFFADVLTPDEIERLAGRVMTRDYERGSALIREDDIGTSMFVIVAGDVTVSVRGRKEAVATLGPGAVVGEMSLMTGARRSATVTAAGKVVAIEIDKPALEPLLAHSPVLVDRFAAMLDSRQAELDRIYGAGHWSLFGLGNSDMGTLIRTFFAGSI